jgi:hypothetical protein
MRGFEYLDVEPGFCTGFDEHDVEFLRPALAFFCGNTSAEIIQASRSYICKLQETESGLRLKKQRSPLVNKIGFVPN